MKRYGWFAGSVGVLVLSAGLMLMTETTSYGSTTKSWDTEIPVATRFVVLSGFGGAAVRDNETGLVWERSPHTTSPDWLNARGDCTNRTAGGRKGWRMPSIFELASLVDPSQSNPALPAGHPFIGVQSAFYWSVTTDANFSNVAWFVNFSDGHVTGDNKTNSEQTWCVRGPMNADAY